MHHIKRLMKHIIATIIPDKVYANHINRILRRGIKQWRHDCNAMKLRASTARTTHELAICAIMKNEGPYLREWIEYHRLVGVTKFYLYDNDSNDDTKKILAPYIKSGLVEYTFFPGEKQQKRAYDDCVTRFNMNAKWIAFIDLDEFIVPKKHSTIPEMLDSLPPRVTQVVIDWAIFGSNGHERKPRGLVMDSYTMRARKSWLYKSIINPRLTFGAGVHESDVIGAPHHISKHIVQINHYHCKSWAEYQKRAARGEACSSLAAGMAKYQRDTFNRHDKNEVYDNAILRFAPAVRRTMGKNTAH